MEGTGAVPQGEVDPLVGNGLASPTCARGLDGELPAVDRRHCATSGFLAAPAPTGNYGIDVHIDTGLFGLSSGGLLSAVQDLFVTPLWMALVWASHAIVVMLEWSFAVDLLPGAGTSALGGVLREMEQGITEPWLALSLAVASGLAAYHGLVRRRVAETVGETLVMLAMMAGGLWVVVDPVDTIGSVAGFVNQAALGTFAVAARGQSREPGASFAAGMDAVFSAAVEGPWCYLEFGDVAWCREAGRLDPRLRAAGLRLADAESALVGCDPHAGALFSCAVAGSPQAQALEHSAALLREARTNGEIFLALAPNGPARNAIGESGSLLRTLCRADSLASCRGPTAAMARFRSDGATWSRVGGVLLIAGGLLGLLLLLGFLAVRLLSAALLSLLYLMLAPAMVLAPAFGEVGRALFRRWAAHLLGAVVAKLLFAFLLGVVVALLGIIAGLASIGWWTQWLLMSTLWWGAFLRRKQALGAAGTARGDRPARRRSLGEILRPPRRAVRFARDRLGRETDAPHRLAPSQQGSPRVQAASAPGHGEPGGTSLGEPGGTSRGETAPPVRGEATWPVRGGPAGTSRGESSSPVRGGPSNPGRGHARPGSGRMPSPTERSDAGGSASVSRGAGGAPSERPPGDGGRLVELLAQRDRVRAAQREASAAGRRRRSVELADRASRIEGEVREQRAGSPGSRPAGGDGRRGMRREALDRALAAQRELRADPVRAARESRIMQDAREVEAGRKRQLGFDRE